MLIFLLNAKADKFNLSSNFTLDLGSDLLAFPTLRINLPALGNNLGVVGDGESTAVNVWSQSQGGFNLLKGGSNITVTLYDNVSTFNTANIYTSSQVNTKLNDYVLSTTLNGYYTKSAVDGLISRILDSAPENLNSLREIALSLGNDSNL